jgi:hypothetical protein
MTIQFQCTVHRVSSHPVARSAVIDDEVVSATILEVEVELTTGADNSHGNFVLRFSKPSEVALALNTFKQDGTVTVTIY